MTYAIAAHTALAFAILFAGGAAAQAHDPMPAGQPGAMSGRQHMDMKQQGDGAAGHRHEPGGKESGAMKMGGEMPADLDMARAKLSRQKRYKVTIAPQQPKLSVNVMHGWVLEIMTPEGQPVNGAKVSIDGGMPAHGHGLPTSPRVTRELGDGKYLVEGMKFNMAGWWQLKFAIDSGGHNDHVTFNVVLK